MTENNLNILKTVVVLSVGRSGTSALAHILEILNVDMGQNISEKPSLSNVKGHFEDMDFVSLNNEILDFNGGSWSNPPTSINSNDKIDKKIQSTLSNNKTLWGWKDPRTTMTFDLFRPYLNNPYLIICTRNPKNTADSICKRDNTDFLENIQLINKYQSKIVETLNKYPDIPYLFVSYEDIIHKPLKESEKIAIFLNISINNKQKQQIKNFILNSDQLSRAKFFLKITQSINKLKSKLTVKIKLVIKILKEKLSLSDNGERVDIIYNDNINFNELDVYQKSHYKRYEYAAGLIDSNSIVADMACGTGYGSVMLSKHAKEVIGVDINSKVIDKITKRYEDIKNISFVNSNLLDINYHDKFDTIISFETVEHLEEKDVPRLFSIFNQALKGGGKIVFSVPYMQEKSEIAIKMGFHLTFDINEEKVKTWLNNSGFEMKTIKYQNYETHTIEDSLAKKDFIIIVATKK